MNDHGKFIEAVKEGSIINVRRLMKLDYLHRYLNGLQAIHWICRNGHLEILKYLHQNKCDLTATDEEGSQPIHYACYNGHLKILKYLHQNKCDLAAADKEGSQPIHCACYNGHLKILKYLHRNKCDLEVTNKEGWQPIHVACYSNKIDILQYLIKNNCDPNIKNKDRSAISLANNDSQGSIKYFLRLHELEKQMEQDPGREQQEEVERELEMSPQRIKIAALMGLSCDADCNHIFCKTSFESSQFELGELIAHGPFVKVYKVKESNSDREFAIKEVGYTTREAYKESKPLENAINVFRDQIQYGSIVQYFGAIMRSPKLYIFLEYMAGGSLEKLLKSKGPLPHDTTAHYSSQILQGLAFLHDNRIIHRDIRPANMLLNNTEDTVKLCDFGINRFLESIASHQIPNVNNQKYASSFSAASYYIAPEVILDQPYGYPADIWSIGASMIEMLSGHHPNYGLEPVPAIFTVGLTRTIEYSQVGPLPNEVRSFIDQMIKSEPTERATAVQLLECDFIRIKKSNWLYNHINI